MKLYCVKEYKPGEWLTKGKIYEASKSHIRDRWVITFDDGYTDKIFNPKTEHFPDMPAIVGFNLIPLVSRPAKVGEWVYITTTNSVFAKQHHIYKVVETEALVIWVDGTHEGTKKICCFHEGYLVLGGYKPERKEQMTKDDLKKGMIVKHMDGELREILEDGHDSYLGVCLRDDLTNSGGYGKDMDVVAVYSPIWKREEVTEMTMEEINAALGKTIKVVEKHA